MLTPPSPSSSPMILTDNHIQSQAATTGDTGIIDIGKNCSTCHRLDFLPFVCEYCKLTFCEDHRRLDSHQCKYQRRHNNQGGQGGYRYTGPSAASLFPDNSQRKRQQELKFVASQLPEPINASQSLPKSALQRFKWFIDKNLTLATLKLKKDNSPMAVVAMKPKAQGDNKIAIGDRVYVWTVYVDGDLNKLNVEKVKKSVFVLKKWPIGRALDVIADIYSITNNNNATNDDSNRLNLFKLNDRTPVVILPSDRCQKLNNGDTLFLVKGSI